MNDSLHYCLMVAHFVFRRNVLTELARTCPDLSPGQPKVIDYLMENPGSIQCQIAGACVIEPPTLTNILAKMETDGLIQRSRDGENRRNVTVTLTEQGVEAGRAIRDVFETLEARALAGLSKTEAKRLVELLKKLRHNLLEDGTDD